MAVMNQRTLREGVAKLVELGYVKCDPQHVKITATHTCYHKPGTESHVCISKRGARVELEPMEG